MAQFSYVPDKEDQYTGIDAIPAGQYKIQIVDSDVIESKSGDAEMIKLVYEVIGDQQFNGRKIFDNIIVAHRTSIDAVRIGKQKLNTICVLTNTKSLKDTAQLHGKSMSVLVATKEYNGAMQNSVKKYMPFNSADENHSGTPEEMAAQAAPAGKKKPSFVKA